MHYLATWSAGRSNELQQRDVAAVERVGPSCVPNDIQKVYFTSEDGSTVPLDFHTGLNGNSSVLQGAVTSDTPDVIGAGFNSSDIMNIYLQDTGTETSSGPGTGFYLTDADGNTVDPQTGWTYISEIGGYGDPATFKVMMPGATESLWIAVNPEQIYY